MEKIGALCSSEQAIAILAHRWWPQTAKEEGYKINQKVLKYGRTLEMSLWGRNGAPSRKGCVVNGQMTKASNK